MKRPRRKARPLPPPHGATGQLFGRTVRSYTVGSWCPTPDGSGKPTAVTLQLDLGDDPGLQLFLRLKSPAAVDEMVAALLRHKYDVWPCGRDSDFEGGFVG